MPKNTAIRKGLLFSGLLLILLSSLSSWGSQDQPWTLIAQSEMMDDVYDPFSDFSEFEESAEQESDINFFKNGRFFNIGLLVGARGYSENMAKVYNTATSYGIFLTYFFDLRFAMQFSYLTGEGSYLIKAPGSERVSGNAELTTFGINFKYYLNTQNVTKGLAAFNPYFIFGFSSHTRTLTNDSTINIGRDTASGFDLGLGIEFPLLKNKMYVGLQGAYHVASFKDESQEIEIDGVKTGITPSGDIYSALVALGINFN